MAGNNQLNLGAVPLPSSMGGTGSDNTGKDISLSGNFTTLGAYDIEFTVTGVTNVTFPTSGTLATTSSLPTLPLSLADGGTGNNLTASLGGIFYSTNAQAAILSGTATANQMLQSGASSAPTWSATTWPATTTANNILFSSSSNTISEISTSSNGVLITSAGSIPSISSALPATVQGNITSVGTIGSGIWQGTNIAVSNGGTGRSTATEYAVLCGGTTTTAAHQSIASVGTSGQILTSNGAGALPTFQTNAAALNAFNSIVIQTFTANGTYTPTTGMKYCTIELVGGGGGGGGAATNGVSNSSAAGGGGAGGYARRTFSAAQVGASASVTIGAAGTAGAAGNNTGGTGGNTSIALTGAGTITMTGNGGVGGSGGPTSATAASSNGGAGGTATNGDINVTGNIGQPSFAFGALLGTTDGGFGGAGASGIFGAGASTVNGFNLNIAGSSGNGKGSGGSGAVVMRSGTQLAGGSGTAGLIVVTEYVST